MINAKRLFITAAVAILLLVNTVCAQEQNPVGGGRSTIAVTAAATADRVRFTAPATVVQMRLEVYNANGERLFDNEIRGGNVIDWHLQDGQAQRLSDGSYLCVITSKSLSGRIGQKLGRLTIENTVATVHPIDTTQFTAQQIQAVGPLEENASLTVMKEGESQTATFIAHDGTEAQITRGRGALSFRIGDFFTGKDAEQMRLTPEGNLGIGITNPVVRLDVDGLIRASQGIVFPDGSIQYSASKKTFGPESLRPGQALKKPGQGTVFETASPDTSGTGTTGTIPKWSDGPNGVLTDSNITELNGAIGINGTPNTNFRLDVNGSVLFRGSNPGFNLVGLRPAGNQWVFQTVDDDGRFRLFSQDNSNPGVERLTISLGTGNVGIGTNNPTGPLHVVASVNSVANAPIISGAIDNVLLVLSSTNPGGRKWFLDSAAGGSFYGAGNFAIGNGSSFPAAPTMVLTPNGNVGIGTTSPTLAKLQVVSSTGDGVYAQGFSFGTGISGHTISGTGVNGTADQGGVGVQGNSNSGYGVYGDSDGTGVYGHSNNGYGVRGQSTNGNGVYGYSQNSFAGYFDGTVRVASIPAGSHIGTVCFNPAGDLLYCEGSSLRFKTHVQPFRAGLDIIRRLRPISFNWKEDGKPDIGLGAEDVAEIAPTFVTTNNKGVIEGVKYERLNILLINAVKEQQKQIERLNARLRQLQVISRRHRRRGGR